MSKKKSDDADVSVPVSADLRAELMAAPSLTDFFDQLNREAYKKAFNNMTPFRSVELPAEKLPRP